MGHNNTTEFDVSYHEPIYENIGNSECNYGLSLKIQEINNRQKKLANNIRELIKILQSDSRQNDQNAASKLKEGILDLLNNSSLQKPSREKIKNHVFEEIKKYTVLSNEQKVELENAIKSAFDDIDNDRELNENILKIKEQKQKEVQHDSLSTELSSSGEYTNDQTKLLYYNFLNNEHTIKKITSIFSQYITNVALKRDKSLLRSILKVKTKNLQDKLKNKKDVLKPNPSSRNERTNKNITRYGKNYRVRDSYNGRRISNKKSFLIQSLLREKLKKRFKSWISAKIPILKLFEKKFWKDKYKKYITPIIVERFRGKGLFGKFFGALTLGADLIWGAGKLLFKGTLYGAQLGLRLCKGIFNIGTKIISGTFTILKNILGLSVKIFSGIVGSAASILKHLKWFLMTPFGAYAFGFIVGFLKTKIKQFYKDNKDSIINLPDEIKDLVENTTNWFKEKDSQWNSKTFILDKDGNKVGWERSLYGKIRVKILGIVNFIKEFYSIFTDKDPNNWDQVKDLIEKKVNYSEKTLKIESFISDIEKWFRKGKYEELVSKIELELMRFKNIGLLEKINTLVNLHGSGQIKRYSKVKAISSAASTAFKYGGVLIGSLFGPLGSLIGGGVSGILSGLVQSYVEYQFSKQKFSENESIEVDRILKSMNKRNENDINPYVIRNKKSELDKEIKDLEKKLKRNPESEDLKEKYEAAKKERELLDLLSQNEDDTDLYVDRADNVSDDQIIGSGLDNLIGYIIADNQATQHKLKEYDIKVPWDPFVRALYEKKAEYIRYTLKKYSLQLGSGFIDKNKFVELVKQDVQKFDNQRINEKTYEGEENVKGVTIGELTTFDPRKRNNAIYRLNNEFKTIAIKNAQSGNVMADGTNQLKETFLRNLSDRYVHGETQYRKEQLNILQEYIQHGGRGGGRIDKNKEMLIRNHIEYFLRYTNIKDKIEREKKFNEIFDALKIIEKHKEKIEVRIKDHEERFLSGTGQQISLKFRKFNGWALSHKVNQEKLEQIYQDMDLDSLTDPKDKKKIDELNNRRTIFDNLRKTLTKEQERYINILKVQPQTSGISNIYHQDNSSLFREQDSESNDPNSK